MTAPSVAIARRHPSLPYVAPFVFFFLFMFLADHLAFLGRWEYPLRVALLAMVLWVFSRHVIDLRAPHWLTSTLLGIAVFAIWVGPDLLIPGYRELPLFQNSLTGTLKSSLPEMFRNDPMVLLFRTIRAVILVPIIEELFWRAWLMRWLINHDFERVPLGTYATSAMWITAILFASEHGPFWDVGLIAGLAYNWWMVRTKSLGDCILAHGVTNLCLSLYVIATGEWQYW